MSSKHYKDYAYDRWRIKTGLCRNGSGWTKERFDTAYRVQAGRCAICQKVFESAWETCADHAHGEEPILRSLLCRGCNLGLGHFKDDPKRLTEAAAYLLAHQALQEKVL